MESEIIQLCRASLLSAIGGQNKVKIRPTDFSHLESNRGIYVSLYKGVEPRGCMGVTAPVTDISRRLVQLTAMAAIHDDRFAKVRLDELNNIDIRVWIIESLRPVRALQDINFDKFGAHILHDKGQATVLPYFTSFYDCNGLEVKAELIKKSGLTSNEFNSSQIFELGAKCIGPAMPSSLERVAAPKKSTEHGLQLHS